MAQPRYMQNGDVASDAFDDDVVRDREPDDVSALESIDGLRLVEPMSVARANRWLSSWARRLGVS